MRHIIAKNDSNRSSNKLERMCAWNSYRGRTRLRQLQSVYLRHARDNEATYLDPGDGVNNGDRVGK